MPNYWSGTNCRASGSAQVGEPIAEAYLYLNGQEVARWIPEPGSDLPLSMSLKVMFDSSHFPHDTAVEVTYLVIGAWTGFPYIGFSDPDPVVKNRLMMFEDAAPPIPDPVPVVQGLMVSKNYALWPETSYSWTKEDFTDKMWGACAMFFAGHGAPAWHSAPVGPGMTPTLYEVERDLINGSGLPPFNATEFPQVNFCHLVACKCGDTSDFKTALYPYYMGWGGTYLENQAVVAYSAFTSQNHRAANAHLIWEKLSRGWTARDTYNWIRDVWIPAHAEDIPMSDVDPPNWRPYQIADLNLICGPDFGTMRLKTVYTADNSRPSDHNEPWSRPL
jgi:hypothetical protein